MALRTTFVAIAALAVAAAGLVPLDPAPATELPVYPANAAHRPANAPVVSSPGLNIITTDTSSPLQLAVNKAIVVDLPRDAANVLVGSPDILTVTMRTSRRAYVSGVREGQSNVFFFDDGNRPIGLLDVYVTNRAPLAVPNLVTVLRYRRVEGKELEYNYLRCNYDTCTTLPYYVPHQTMSPTIVIPSMPLASPAPAAAVP
jgi:Pilus formation protein N terminal region